jgi:hypothetical protein
VSITFQKRFSEADGYPDQQARRRALAGHDAGALLETFLKAAVTCADTSANTAPSTDEKIAAVSCGNPQHRNGRLRRLPVEF